MLPHRINTLYYYPILPSPPSYTIKPRRPANYKTTFKPYILTQPALSTSSTIFQANIDATQIPQSCLEYRGNSPPYYFSSNVRHSKYHRQRPRTTAGQPSQPTPTKNHKERPPPLDTQISPPDLQIFVKTSPCQPHGKYLQPRQVTDISRGHTTHTRPHQDVPLRPDKRSQDVSTPETRDHSAEANHQRDPSKCRRYQRRPPHKQSTTATRILLPTASAQKNKKKLPQ